MVLFKNKSERATQAKAGQLGRGPATEGLVLMLMG